MPSSAPRVALLAALLAGLLAGCCQARPPPDATTTAFGGGGRRADTGSTPGSTPAQTFFVLLDRAKMLRIADAKALAETWWDKLGKDSRLRISAASKTKLVVAVRGDDDFQNSIVAALRSFPETRVLEKRPLYVPLGRSMVGITGMQGPGAEQPRTADI